MRVVIAPATEATEEVLDCMRAWSRARLLDPFCIWRVPIETPPQDTAGVARIELGEDLIGTLPETLGDTPTDRITLLGFYPARRDQVFNPDFGQRVRDCVRLASGVLAYDKLRPLECTMVVVPGRTAQPVPTEVFCGDRNLYVAPEDRPAPRTPNQLPDSSGILPRHGAHALATIADLWADGQGRSSTVLEEVAAEDIYAIDPPAVRMVRTFSRVVDFGYVADHIAAGVFQAGEEWPNPDPDHFDRVNDAAPVVKHAVRELVKVHGETIGLTKFEPIELPAERRPTLLEAVRELFGMLRARIRRLPAEFERATVGAAHDFLAERIDTLRGPDAPRTLRWRERPESDRAIVDIAAELDQPVPMPDGPTGALWGDLRRLVFSLVDGSEPPARIDASGYSRAGKQALVTKPAALVPDPSQLPPGDLDGRACDPLTLDPRFNPTEGDDATDEEEMSEEMKSWLEGRRGALLWGVGYEIATALTAARGAAAEQAAEAEAAETAAKDDSGPETENDEKQGRSDGGGESRWRRLRNSLLLDSGIAIAASALVWTRLAVVPALVAQAIIAVLALGAFMYLAWRFVLRERAILRAEARRQFEIVNAALRRALHAGDLPRLERRYAEYLDWAEIIGWMVHEPWVGEPVERVEMPGPIPPSTLPAALRVGVASFPQATLDRLANQARATVFRPRWLTSQYGLVASQAMDRVALSYSYSGTEGSPDPDGDTLDDPDSPRRQLLDAIRHGEGRRLQDNEMTGEVLRFVDRIPIDAATEEVHSAPLAADAQNAPAGNGTDPLPPCAAWFSPPESLATLAPPLLEAVVRISADSPAGPHVGLGVLVSPEGIVLTSLRVVARARSVRITAADGASCEAELFRALPEADIALLKLGGEEQVYKEVSVASSSDAPPGEPIFAPSPPQEPDLPPVALGLITAEHEPRPSGIGTDFSTIGVAYRTAAGPAGTPAFDLDGKLVGIHIEPATNVDANDRRAVRTVVRAGIAQALLDAEDGALESATVSDLGQTPRRTRRSTSGSTPSRFVAGLFPAVDGPIGLLPQHWIDPDDQHLTVMVGEKPTIEGVDLRSLSTGAEFLRPLRVLVHRVDMTPAVAARELASCRD